ncbi:YIR protein, partial [Plasmodium yoelii]
MDYRLCARFDKLRSYLPDELNISTSNDIHSLGNAKNYCPNGDSGETECKTDLDKINAGCLWLFEQNVVNRISTLSKDHSKVFIIYVMIWLDHMLNLKKNEKIKNLNDFYEGHIKNNTHYTKCNKKNNNNYEDCSNKLNDKTGYNNFKEFIDANKCLMDIDINDVPNLYAGFKSLCKMYTELDSNDKTSKKYLENAKEFVKTYDELNKNSNITKDSPYYKVLSTLSNDYNNFKSYCNKNKINCSDIQSLSPIKVKENSVQSSAHNHVHDSGVTSSS